MSSVREQLGPSPTPTWHAPRRDARDVTLAVAADLVRGAREVTLLAHNSPDADALGSALALGLALHRRGATVRVSFATPAAPPESLRDLAAGFTADAPVERILRTLRTALTEALTR